MTLSTPSSGPSRTPRPGSAFGDDDKGETILDNASTRLDEVDKLSQQKDPDAKLVTQTLDTFSSQFTEAGNALLADYESNGNEQSIETLHESAADSVDLLGQLEGSIPPAAHDSLLNAAQTVLGLDQEALQICPECGEGILDVPAPLLAGDAGALDDVTGALAGGQLPGADVPSDASQPQHQNGGKGDRNPSGMNPPETPIELPTVPTDTTTDLGGLLPTGGTDTSGGNGGNGGNGGKDGKGGKVDLAPVTDPVTDTVNEVVTGVVEGVNGLLNGLTGGQ